MLCFVTYQTHLHEQFEQSPQTIGLALNEQQLTGSQSRLAIVKHNAGGD